MRIDRLTRFQFVEQLEFSRILIVNIIGLADIAAGREQVCEVQAEPIQLVRDLFWFWLTLLFVLVLSIAVLLLDFSIVVLLPGAIEFHEIACGFGVTQHCDSDRHR